MKKSKHDPRQLDLFGYEQSLDDRVHEIKCRIEKDRRSFMVRYNVIIKALDEIQAEVADIEHELQMKKMKAI